MSAHDWSKIAVFEFYSILGFLALGVIFLICYWLLFLFKKSLRNKNIFPFAVFITAAWTIASVTSCIWVVAMVYSVGWDGEAATKNAAKQLVFSLIVSGLSTISIPIIFQKKISRLK